MKVKLKLNNAEVPMLVKYISLAKSYACGKVEPALYIQGMVRHLVFEQYRKLGNRYMHDDRKPSYMLTLTGADASALMLYYESCPIPANQYSQAILRGIFDSIHQQLIQP